MGKWVFKLLAMMLIGGVVIFVSLMQSDSGLMVDTVCFGYDFSKAGDSGFHNRMMPARCSSGSIAPVLQNNALRYSAAASKSTCI